MALDTQIHMIPPSKKNPNNSPHQQACMQPSYLYFPFEKYLNSTLNSKVNITQQRQSLQMQSKQEINQPTNR